MQNDLGLKSDCVKLNTVSFGNNLWKLNSIDPDLISKISGKYNIPYITALLLSTRCIQLDAIDKFINPKLKNLMPNPFLLSDMDKAVDRIIKAIKTKEYICIYGDYDVDGATSSALLYKFLTAIGYDENKIMLHIPDRLLDGYGLNTNFIRQLSKARKYTLIITVDCGITALSEVDIANSLGIDTVIIDHHQPESNLPKAVAVVNPKKINEKVDYSYMAAVGVCFFTVFALYSRLKNSGYFIKNLIKEPDLLSLLDLVALGTVCDVVPVIGINRAFIKTGLQVLKNRTNVGLKLLSDVSEINKELTPYHLGFVLGPRINAGGRIGDSSIGAKLLSSTNPIIARNYAEQLNNYNIKRCEMERLYLNEIYEKLDIENCKNDNLIFVSGENWHPGVIGIIASKIKEKYNLPTFIASIDKATGIAKGSARSVENIDIGSLVLRAKEHGILIQGGGHGMAAGFTYHMDNEKRFISFLQTEITMQLAGKKIFNVLNIDAVINISAVNLEFAKNIEKLSPFGEKNPEPIFLIKDVTLSKIDIIHNLHLSAIFTNINNFSIRTISFKSVDTNMGKLLLNNVGKNFDIVGMIRINNYKDSDSVSFILEDANFVTV